MEHTTDLAALAGRLNGVISAFLSHQDRTTGATSDKRSLNLNRVVCRTNYLMCSDIYDAVSGEEINTAILHRKMRM